MAAIGMMILLMVIAIVGFIFFTMQDRKEAKKTKHLKVE